MSDTQPVIDPRTMTPAQAHAEAVRRIEAAAESGQHWLDLGDLPLEAVPEEIARLAGQLRELSLGILAYDKNSRDWIDDAGRVDSRRLLKNFLSVERLTALHLLDLTFCTQLIDLAPLQGLATLQSLNL